MLNSEVVDLDFEGFRHKKTGFIIKEISICSNSYSDTILFLPPVPHNSLSASERKSHQWVSRFLHGLSWSTGNYPYLFLSQSFIALKLRFPSGKFYAKGKEKSESLQTLFQKDVVDLDTLFALKWRKFLIQLNILPVFCNLSIYPRNKRKNIVQKEKHSCISIG